MKVHFHTLISARSRQINAQTLELNIMELPRVGEYISSKMGVSIIAGKVEDIRRIYKEGELVEAIILLKNEY